MQDKDKKHGALSLMLSVTARAVATAGAFALTLMVFYLVGSRQRFLDSSMDMILRAETVASAALCLLSVAALALSAILAAKDSEERPRNIFYAVVMLVSLALGASLLALSTVIKTLSMGM